jgi:hypothetical protein
MAFACEPGLLEVGDPHFLRWLADVATVAGMVFPHCFPGTAIRLRGCSTTGHHLEGRDCLQSSGALSARRCCS